MKVTIEGDAKEIADMLDEAAGRQRITEDEFLRKTAEKLGNFTKSLEVSVFRTLEEQGQTQGRQDRP